MSIQAMKQAKNAGKHGACSNGRMTSTYKTWTGMKYRCLNPKNTSYHRYGGAGITVCERWMSFENFLSDMGERPAGMSLDRIDNSKGYSPENCRWATNTEQQRNKSNNHRVTYNGITKTLAEWAEFVGMKQMKLVQRVLLGWAFEDAINDSLKINPKKVVMQSNNKTGCTGVSFHKASGKYWARMQHGGKTKHLGLFDTLDSAINARKQEEQEMRNGQ